ncbi:MAG: hypothetical protein IJ727_08255 [Treponema sp.]|nr:hypothetical protein [Treponema sp.]
MVSLTKAGAPETVRVDGAFFAVKTDFRYWIRFSQMLKEKHPFSDYDFLYQSEIPEDRAAGFNALTEFFLDKKELPKVRNGSDGTRAFDYGLDAGLIFAAFYELYRIDLTEARLHWHKFRALMDGLHGTKFNEVMGYRLYNPNEKTDYKKAMMELQEMWELPEELTEEEQKAIDDFDSLLKN